MNLTGPPSDKQIAKLHARWKRMSSRGLILHTLYFGTLLFAWMCACYVGLMCLGGHQRLLQEPFVRYTTVPCFLLMAYAAPIAQYQMVKQMVRRITTPAEI